MLPKEHPKEHGPSNDRLKEALDGAIAAAGASPARYPHHGDPTAHGQQGPDDPAQLPDGRGLEVRAETLYGC